ncbi:DNA-primase RepB domain-containing protein [Falsiroseomonas sp. E2-1-a20]|uniref:DNA-primase RepB domain-containing protein n=1 Tax=Falsiroseomonas sp. E2-1-a20 TaxID=3239300 RepID=UPI003F35DCF4
MPLGGRARDVVARWCSALPARDFLVAVRSNSDGRCVQARISRGDLLAALGWLRHRNALGAHVVARPWGTRHVLVDGLTPGRLERLAAQHQSAIVVEAEPGLLQAWVTVAEDDVEAPVAAAVARTLARAFGGLIPTASARALGGLPAFTHPAMQRHPDGRPRFLRIISCIPPRVDGRAADLLVQANAELARIAARRGAGVASTSPYRGCWARHDG